MNSRETIIDSIKTLANTKNEGVGVDEAGSVSTSITNIPTGIRKGILKRIKGIYIYIEYFAIKTITLYKYS